LTTYTIDIAKENFVDIVNNTIDNSKTTIISTSKGSVVMIDQNEWSSIQESIKLLNDKRALKSLLKGHLARKDSQDYIKAQEQSMSNTWENIEDEAWNSI
jgi:PHD/YefM family antitoxin component YafN of YafNO toxin-antitoxin module